MLKVFLLTRNDTKFLEDWILYHGFLFGLEHIHILDGSDCQEAFEIYAKFKPLGLHVHHSSSGLNELAEEMTQLMQAEKGTNNFLIKLDTDEFIALTDTFLTSLPRFLLRGIGALCFRTRPPLVGPTGDRLRAQVDRLCANGVVHTTALKEFFAQLPITGQRYKAAFTACSIPQAQPVPRPARSLTDFMPLEFTPFKSFFHSSSFVSVDLGSHVGVSHQNEGVIPTALTIIHFRDTSVADVAERARQVLISHRYIDIDDPVEQQAAKLGQLSRTRTTPSYHKVKMYLSYLESKALGATVDPILLCQHNPAFRPTAKRRHLSFVQDTLTHIGKLGASELAASLQVGSHQS